MEEPGMKEANIASSLVVILAFRRMLYIDTNFTNFETKLASTWDRYVVKSM